MACENCATLFKKAKERPGLLHTQQYTLLGPERGTLEFMDMQAAAEDSASTIGAENVTTNSNKRRRSSGSHL
jgi:hypothetical protein